MAITYKTLGQAAPNTTTETDLYTVPASTSVVCSTLVICNRGSTGTVRVSVSVGGGATANKDYIIYDVSVDVGNSLTFTLGITLAATDIVRVYASTADFSFNLFGSEFT